MQSTFSGFIWRAAVLAALAGALTGTACTSSTPSNGAIRIGVPDGASEVLVNDAVQKMNYATEVTQIPEIVDYFDCCSSSTQWALSSLSLDAAILCPDEAKALIEKDDRYWIVGPCLANSVMVVIRDLHNTSKIGVAQSRQFQEEIVYNLFGRESQVKPMLPQALPTAYEKMSVDGVVVDIEQAFRLNGTRLSINKNGTDIVTYVLVARKDIVGMDDLIAVLSKAAEELNNADGLERAMKNLEKYREDSNLAGAWLDAGIRFLSISDSTGNVTSSVLKIP